MIAVTVEQLHAAAPNGDPEVIEAIAATSAAAFAKWQINSLRRVWGFLSTCVEETGLRNLLEDMDYTAYRAHEIWPSMFPTTASAEPYAGQPQKLADRVYGGRMGNHAETDDGWNFRGHGLIGITGRSNFVALAKIMGLDVVDHPEITIDPTHLLDCALAIFTESPAVLRYCDSGDWRAVWAIIGSGRANGPVINLGNHEGALAAVQRAIPKLVDAPAPTPLRLDKPLPQGGATPVAAAPAPDAQPSRVARLEAVKATLVAANPQSEHEGWLARLEAVVAEWTAGA